MQKEPIQYELLLHFIYHQLISSSKTAIGERAASSLVLLKKMNVFLSLWRLTYTFICVSLLKRYLATHLRRCVLK